MLIGKVISFENWAFTIEGFIKLTSSKFGLLYQSLSSRGITNWGKKEKIGFSDDTTDTFEISKRKRGERGGIYNYLWCNFHIV